MLKSIKWIGTIAICLIIMLVPINNQVEASAIDDMIKSISQFIINTLVGGAGGGTMEILYFLLTDLPLFLWDMVRMLFMIFRSFFADNPEIFNGIIAGIFTGIMVGGIFGSIVPILGNIVGAILGAIIGFLWGLFVGLYNWMGLNQPGAFQKPEAQPVALTITPVGG